MDKSISKSLPRHARCTRHAAPSNLSTNSVAASPSRCTLLPSCTHNCQANSEPLNRLYHLHCCRFALERIKPVVEDLVEEDEIEAAGRSPAVVTITDPFAKFTCACQLACALMLTCAQEVGG